MRRLLVAALGCISSFALAADTLSIDSLAGVYTVRVGNVPERTPPTAENILEIARVTQTSAYVRLHVEARNGDLCKLFGVAKVEENALTYRRLTDNGICVFSVSREVGNIVLHDKGGICKRTSCGVSAGYEGVSFPVSSRRDIRYMPRLLASREYKAALAEAGAAPATPSAAASVPTIAPMHSEASLARYPRISGLANAAIQQRVNAIFAAREKSAREDREGCFGLIRDAGQRPTDANFAVRIDVHYVSKRYVSMEVRRSYDCAGAYPNDGIPEPLTIDLTTGKEVNWRALFEKGFFADDTTPDAVPFLTELYQKHYATEGGAADPECKRVVSESTGEMFVWLDAKRGLVVQPDFPHALQACGDEIALTPAEIGDYIELQEFYDDLKATVHR